MIDEDKLATTNISLSCRIAPVGNVVGDLSGIISNYSREMVGAFYSRQVSRKVDAVLTELINNVLENVSDGSTALDVKLDITDQVLTIEVSNHATEEQAERVQAHVNQLNDTQDIRGLLRSTIRARRAQRLKGGLGLMRLIAENKFDIRATFDHSVLTVESRIHLGGLI